MFTGEANKNSELLNFAVNNSPAVFYISDPGDNFRITYISENIGQLTGHKADDILADRNYTRKFIHEDDREELEHAFERLSGTDPQSIRYRFRKPNDDYVWLRDDLRYVVSADFDERHVVGCIMDITNEMEAQSDRDRLSGLLHDAIETTPNGFAVYDTNERLVLCNGSFAELFGEPPDKLVGLQQNEIIRRSLEETIRINGEFIDDPRSWAERQMTLDRSHGGVGTGRRSNIPLEPTEEKRRRRGDTPHGRHRIEKSTGFVDGARGEISLDYRNDAIADRHSAEIRQKSRIH
jgi:PAS domain S-box-containing protein